MDLEQLKATDRLPMSGKVVDSVYEMVDTVSVTAVVGTRDRLIDVARAYLDQEGIDGIGLREIARRAGVSHGAPLRHFPTLGALLGAVAAEGFRDLIVAVDHAVHTAPIDDPVRRLAAAAFGYQRFALSHPGVFGLMFRRDLCDTNDAEYITTGGMAFGQLVALVTDAQNVGFHPDHSASELAGVLWATSHGLASLHLHGALAPTTGQVDPAVLQRLANAVVFGIPIDSEESP